MLINHSLKKRRTAKQPSGSDKKTSSPKTPHPQFAHLAYFRKNFREDNKKQAINEKLRIKNEQNNGKFIFQFNIL